MDRFLDFHKRVYEPACEGFLNKFKKKEKYVAPTFASIAAFCDAEATPVELRQRFRDGIVNDITLNFTPDSISKPLSPEYRSAIIKMFGSLPRLSSDMKTTKFTESKKSAIIDAYDGTKNPVTKAELLTAKITNVHISEYEGELEFEPWGEFQHARETIQFCLPYAFDKHGKYTGDVETVDNH